MGNRGIGLLPRSEQLDPIEASRQTAGGRRFYLFTDMRCQRTQRELAKVRH